MKGRARNEAEVPSFRFVLLLFEEVFLPLGNVLVPLGRAGRVGRAIGRAEAAGGLETDVQGSTLLESGSALRPRIVVLLRVQVSEASFVIIVRVFFVIPEAPFAPSWPPYLRVESQGTQRVARFAVRCTGT